MSGSRQAAVVWRLSVAGSVILSQMSDEATAKKRYMVIEHFRDAAAVYRRFRDRGRLAPDGLVYISSWVDEKLERCFQVMETQEPHLLDEWMANWNDLIDFEVYPVFTSQEAAQRIAPRL
jgi:Protein of unknown function (DUF3303)